MADNKELHAMASSAINAKVREGEAKLFDLKLQNSLGKLENTAQIRILRRDIARMKTVMAQKAGKSA